MVYPCEGLEEEHTVHLLHVVVEEHTAQLPWCRLKLEIELCLVVERLDWEFFGSEGKLGGLSGLEAEMVARMEGRCHRRLSRKLQSRCLNW